MTTAHQFRRTTALVASLTLAVPLLMGQGCPFLVIPLSVDAGPDASINFGSTVVLQGSASGGSGGNTFSWSPTTGLNNSGDAQPVFTATTVGVKTFTLTVTDSGGRTATDTVTVTVSTTKPAVVADAGPDRQTAVGQPVTLLGSASGGNGIYSFLWSPSAGLSSATAQQPAFTPTAVGTSTFTLTVTDGEGVSATDSVLVTTSPATALSSLLWGANFSTGGYQLIAIFGQDLNKTSAETPANYRLNGTSAPPVSATLGSDNRTVTLVFSAALSTTSTVDLSVGGGIIDANGNSVPAIVNHSVSANGADTTDPAAASRTWEANFSGSYRINIVFSEAMDKTTAEMTSAYRVNGATTAKTATLSGDGRTVGAVFENVALSSSATIDVSVGGVIKDINGNSVPQSLTLSIAANTADTTPPAVVVARHAANFTTGGYQVTVEFNEAMSKSDAETIGGYAIGATAATSASLGADGRTVTLVFQTPIAIADQLAIGAAVKDINGKAITAASGAIQANSSDTTGPSVSSRVWGNGQTTYQVLVTFNEAIDKATATTVGNYTLAGNTGTDNRHPTAASLDTTGKIATLTFGTTTAGFKTADTLTVSASVKDINGNANTSTTATAITASSADTTGPTVATRVWGNGLTAYQVVVTFSEVLERVSATTASNYTLATKTPNLATLDSTGRIVTLAISSTDGPFLISDTLTVSANVKDINGQANTSIAAGAVGNNTADTTAPSITSAAKVDATHVDVTFSEVMDKTTVNAAVYTITGGNVTAAALRSDGRTVRLTTDVDPAGETVTVPITALDINGNAPAAPLTQAVP